MKENEIKIIEYESIKKQIISYRENAKNKSGKWRLDEFDKIIKNQFGKDEIIRPFKLNDVICDDLLKEHCELRKKEHKYNQYIKISLSFLEKSLASALECYDRAIGLEFYHIVYFYKAGLIFQSDPKKAIKYLELYEKGRSNDKEISEDGAALATKLSIYLEYGKLLNNSKKYSDAIKYYDLIINNELLAQNFGLKDSTYYEAYNEKGRSLESLNSYEEAIKCYKDFFIKNIRYNWTKFYYGPTIDPPR